MDRTHGIILAFDVGTTNLKAALIETKRFTAIAKASKPATIEYPRHGWAEQDLDRLWKDLAELAREIIGETRTEPEAIVYTAHMAGVTPVNADGEPLRKAMIWLDERSAGYPKDLWKGFPKIYGYNVFKLIRLLRVTGGAPGKTGKDPISKLHWIMDNEPDTFKTAYKFLDVKGFLIARATGEYVTSHDEASLTWLTDTRNGRASWHKGLLREYKIPIEKLPRILDSTSIAGRLKRDAADDLGVKPGTPVAVGAGDMTAAGVGSGAVSNGKAHVYIGTSDWIAAHSSKRLLDISHYIGSIMSAIPNYYFVVAEQEVAAGALEWFMEIAGIKKRYDIIEEALETVKPGESSVLFTPWMYGERAPVDEPSLRGVMFNLSLETTREEIIRAIIDGVVLNIKWAYAYFEKLVGPQDHLPAVGGGTLFDEWCRSLASGLDMPIKRVRDPQDAGLRGAAVVAAVGLGLYNSVSEAALRFEYDAVFKPEENYVKVYNKLFKYYIEIYKKNKSLFKKLNK